MATDDYGLFIPVPDENTAPFELEVLVRDALNTIARIITELPRARDHGPALADLGRRLADLEGRPAPTPAADHGPALAALAKRVTELETRPAPADPGPALEALRRDLADLKLANLERTAD